LIAQAVGLGPGPSEAPATTAAEVAAPPTGTPAAEPEHARSEPPLTAEVPDEPPPETLPTPEAAPVAELPPARRRHGGALPS
jgi:hypothetical protein